MKPIVRPSVITMKLPRRFDLARAVCSYGYFLLAPNHWQPASRQLLRPLRGGGDRLINTAIAQRRGSDVLRITCDTRLDAGERAIIVRQVARMLRLDEPAEMFERWHVLHPDARRSGFARLFRSPTLFEDIVKTMTGCNVTWPNTMRMNRLLCEHVGGGGFPTPAELGRCRAPTLKARCKVGYRAGRILLLARGVADGSLDLSPLEDPTRPTQVIYDDLLAIHGIGPYAAANLCQLLGRYDRVAIDTETYRHFRQEHNLPTPKDPRQIHPLIERHFAPFAPFQFLAYWFDLWRGYERRFGDARRWDPIEHGPNFTATRLR